MKKYNDYVAKKKEEYGKKMDLTDINAEFIPAFESGERITVEFAYGERKRGTIGVTTGWKPIFLLMLRKDSRGSSWTIHKNDHIAQ